MSSLVMTASGSSAAGSPRRRVGGAYAVLRLSFVWMAGCASVDPAPDFERARELIGSSTGREEVFSPTEAALGADEIESILSDGLALEEALRLALLNNRRLQAQFMTLGIARADLVQAGLLSNPSLSLLFLLPSGGGRANVQASLAQSVSDLWQIPAQERVAGGDLEVRLLEVSRFAGVLVADARKAYYDSVASRDAVTLARESSASAARALAAVRTRVREGVASQVEEQLAQSLALSADFDLRRAERENTGAARTLASLLSLSKDLADVELVDRLPGPPLETLEREDVVETAVHSRLDLRALDQAIRAADAAVRLERRRAWPEASLSAAGERPEDSGSDLFGPGASITLPIFDQNQAGVQRAVYRRLELERIRDALAFEIGQDVRAAVDRAILAARAVVFVRDELVPQSERSVALARRAYELGDVTLLTLIEAERAALQARRSELEVRLDAARSWNEVERAAGTPLSTDLGRGPRPVRQGPTP